MSEAITMPVKALPKSMRTADASDSRDRGKVPSKRLPCRDWVEEDHEGIALIDSTSRAELPTRGGGERRAVGSTGD